MDTFIVTYVTGVSEDTVEHVIPVSAKNRTTVEKALVEAIEYKQALLIQIRAGQERFPKPDFTSLEALDAWSEHPLVQHVGVLRQEYSGSVRICGRYFPGLDEADIEDFEILFLGEWINAFDVADAIEDKRRWEAAGNTGAN